MKKFFSILWDCKGVLCFFILPIVAVIVGTTIEMKEDVRRFNNGTHIECSGTWSFVDVEHIRNSSDLYYYECEKCHALLRTHNYYKEGVN